MDDHDLILLLRAAAQADALEPADDARLGLPASRARANERAAARGTGRSRWLIGGVIVGSSLAAMIALAVILGPDFGRSSSTPRPYMRAHAQSVESGEHIARHGLAPEPVNAGEPTGGVMLAVFTDQSSDCTYVVTRDMAELGGRDPSTLSDSELLAEALMGSHSASADRVTVIGLSGPRSDLPRTDADAEAMAACLDASATALKNAWESNCVPSGVSVASASLALSGTRR